MPIPRIRRSNKKPLFLQGFWQAGYLTVISAHRLNGSPPRIAWALSLYRSSSAANKVQLLGGAENLLDGMWIKLTESIQLANALASQKWYL